MFLRKLIDKQGNNFIVGLLIVCAGIGVGTVVLTAQDYKSGAISDTVSNYDTPTSSSIILSSMSEQELAFQQMLVRESGLTIDNNNMSNYIMRTTLDFGNNGVVNIKEEYVDENQVIYLCDIEKDDNHQYIKTIVNQDEVLTMSIVNENGEELNERINLPLSISEQIVSSINEMYGITRGKK